MKFWMTPHPQLLLLKTLEMTDRLVRYPCCLHLWFFKNQIAEQENHIGSDTSVIEEDTSTGECG